MCSHSESGFQFILKKIEDGRFECFYAHEKNTLLVPSKPVCTKVELARLKDVLKKTDVIESCSREGMNTKWMFYNLTISTLFGALLKDVLMGCRNAVLH